MLLLSGGDEGNDGFCCHEGVICTEKLARIGQNEQKEQKFFVKNKKKWRKVEESGGNCIIL
ncbi:MAG: hypothetical protein J5734_04210 [Prevotella sp.]|nr:hypothetical protein [Prevotella sp.]